MVFLAVNKNKLILLHLSPIFYWKYEAMISELMFNAFKGLSPHENEGPPPPVLTTAIILWWNASFP